MLEAISIVSFLRNYPPYYQENSEVRKCLGNSYPTSIRGFLSFICTTSNKRKIKVFLIYRRSQKYLSIKKGLKI